MMLKTKHGNGKPKPTHTGNKFNLNKHIPIKQNKHTTTTGVFPKLTKKSVRKSVLRALASESFRFVLAGCRRVRVVGHPPWTDFPLISSTVSDVSPSE